MVCTYEEVRMPKKSHRVNTHKPNGAAPESVEVAPPLISEPVLPPAELALEHLKKLGELNDIALVAHTRHEEAATKARNLKAKAEEADEAVRNYIKEITHPSQPGLFDPQQREADTQAMEAAAAAPLIAPANTEPF